MTTVQPFGGITAGQQEGRLYDYLVRLDRFREKRTALHIHLSQLQPYNRREYNLRIATHLFDRIISQREGEVFMLSNNDFVFVARDVPRLHIDQSLERLRGLFSEDPLVYLQDSGDAFCTWYDLEKDYDKFLGLAKDMMKAVIGIGQSPPKEKTVLRKLDAKSLSSLEDVLMKADITNFVRNQPACFYEANSIKPLFDELYVSIPDLQQTLLPHNDFRGNAWLFQYLTEVLDRRMLVYLKTLDQERARRLSINLNISTVLSPEFHAYDTYLTSNVRGSSFIVELRKHDIFSDMGAYVFARDYLHERSHKVCLDGITHLTLPFIDSKLLKLDLIKLCWSAELLSNKDRALPSLREHVKRIGAQQFIMIHCDAPEALELGAELGISMFQGRYISHLLARNRDAHKQKVAQ